MKIKLNELKYISNLISLFRLLLFIPIVFLFVLIDDSKQFSTFLIIIITIAYFSDLLDGYLARRKNQITELGKLIDPLADKIITMEIISILFFKGLIPDYYFFIIMSRDLLIFLGGILVTKRLHIILPSDYVGKITILSIGLFILVVLFNYSNGELLFQSTLWLSTILAIVSLLNYSLRAIRIIKRHEIV